MLSPSRRWGRSGGDGAWVPTWGAEAARWRGSGRCHHVWREVARRWEARRGEEVLSSGGTHVPEDSLPCLGCFESQLARIRE